jgi:hypothetical protein
MAASFALSWIRSDYWADKLDKPPGKAVSPYRSADYDQVENTAKHINEMAPEMCCQVEVYTS